MANDLKTLMMMRVKELRIQFDLTQEEFAKKAGFGYKYYQSLEAGRKQDIRFSTLERMAEACGLELWELLKFDVKPRPTKQKVGRPWGSKTKLEPADLTRSIEAARKLLAEMEKRQKP